MNGLKKWILALMVAISLIGVTTACSNKDDENENPTTEENQDAETDQNTDDNQDAETDQNTDQSETEKDAQ
ncbi:hypothetical protein [Bacillus sp. T3]|uniref:hypothetical protein n=1 Tax=Bacillus sp. T3 TaxID=467262 RepID=UPI002980B929|nr:hypothetical protein [Bacillus sp. T3]